MVVNIRRPETKTTEERKRLRLGGRREYSYEHYYNIGTLLGPIRGEEF